MSDELASNPKSIALGPFGAQSIMKLVSKLAGLFRAWGAQRQAARDVESFLRLNFLYSATETGLLKSLETPTSKQELLEKLTVRRPPLLDRFLALGVALKELSEENGRYRLAGKRSLEISGDNGETFAAWIQFFVNHVGSIHRDLAPRLVGEPLDDLLSSSGALVSRASRIWEPYVGRFMRTLTSTHRPLRILDVGCGSGTYLRYAAANPQSTGIGIELRDDVAEEASMNLSRWGIDDRFSVVTADIRDPKPESTDGQGWVA